MGFLIVVTEFESLNSDPAEKSIVPKWSKASVVASGECLWGSLQLLVSAYIWCRMFGP